MAPRSTTPQQTSSLSCSSPPLSDVVAPLSRKSIDTPLFHITTLQTSKSVFDVIVSMKGSHSEPITLTFEDVSRNDARAITDTLTNRDGAPVSPRDPVPAVTYMNRAIIYAELHNIIHRTLNGGVGFDALSTFFDEEIKGISSQELQKLITLKGLGSGIYHLSFPSQTLMTSSLLRMQEHFESPRYRGKYFSHAEFRSWYRTVRDHKEFSYYSDWAGFNFPGTVLRPFVEGRFGKLTSSENAVNELFSGMKGTFYIIGTTETDTIATLRHEIAHALYHTNATYRREVNNILASVDCAPIHKILKSLGYHQAQWIDETHAYLGDSLSELESHGVNTVPFTKTHCQLLSAYNRHAVGLLHLNHS